MYCVHYKVSLLPPQVWLDLLKPTLKQIRRKYLVCIDDISFKQHTQPLKQCCFLWETSFMENLFFYKHLPFPNSFRAEEHHPPLRGQVLPSWPHAAHGGADSVGLRPHRKPHLCCCLACQFLLPSQAAGPLPHLGMLAPCVLSDLWHSNNQCHNITHLFFFLHSCTQRSLFRPPCGNQTHDVAPQDAYRRPRHRGWLCARRAL